MRRIAVINQKGGVGKTTTTVNLGAALAEQGRRVVLVDMDAQANLSLSLGVEAESGTPTTYTVLLGESGFADAVRATATPGLSLLPSNIDLSGAEMELASQIGREFLLRDAMKRWADDHRARHGAAPADYVLFDCPPSLGLLAINALAAAGEVLITLQTEFLALQGMSKLVEVVQLLRKRLNPELVITGILPCLYESRVRLAREVLGEIKQYFPGQVLPVPIRSNVKLAEAPSYGKTILQYAPESIGAADYRCAARDVIRMETRDPSLAHLAPFREDVLGTSYRDLARSVHVPRASDAKPASTSAAKDAPAPAAGSAPTSEDAKHAPRAPVVPTTKDERARSDTSDAKPPTRAAKTTKSEPASRASSEAGSDPAKATRATTHERAKHAARDVAAPAPAMDAHTTRPPEPSKPDAPSASATTSASEPASSAKPRARSNAAPKPSARASEPATDDRATLQPDPRNANAAKPPARAPAKHDADASRASDASGDDAAHGPRARTGPPAAARAAKDAPRSDVKGAKGAKGPKEAGTKTRSKSTSAPKDDARAPLRAEDLPPLPPDAFEILSGFDLDP